MPCNYPNNITVVDKSFSMYNMRFDRPVTINITYNLSFWTWVFRALVRRRPTHYVVLTDCHFLHNGKHQQKTKHLLRSLFKFTLRKQVNTRRTV